MEKIIRKKTRLMSLFMGGIMGMVFTIFAQLTNQGKIMPIGIIICTIISIVISLILGSIIPMKRVNDSVCEKLKISSDKKFASLLATSLVSDLIFTPLNCVVNAWYGMAMGLTDLPEGVINPFQRMAYCLELPYFAPAIIKTLLIDLVIGYIICVAISPLINKITNRMCGVLEFLNE